MHLIQSRAMKVKRFMGIHLHFSNFFPWIVSHTTNKQTYTTLEYLIFDTVHVPDIIIIAWPFFVCLLRGHFRFSYNELALAQIKGGCGKITQGCAEGRD